MPSPTFYEFFAGGGMVRAGLGPGWTCAYANDFDPRKAESYQENWGAAGELNIGDIADVALQDLPGRADLMWGSFPCQDLSVAGAGAGLKGRRSSAFFPFWDIVTGLAGLGRGPRIVAIENVRGTLTADGGAGFDHICAAFADTGYRFGPLIVDSAMFTPQSRPRLFIVGVAPGMTLDPGLILGEPRPPFHPPALARAVDALPTATHDLALWWRLPVPLKRNTRLSDIIEPDPPRRAWHTISQTRRLLGLMAPIHLAKVEALRGAGARTVGAVYRRTRKDKAGGKVQRAEVRFDGLAGCLRTPGGGSSRQTVLVIEDGEARSRLLTPRETARLMGLPDTYILPPNANAAYHLTGDGVVTHVVRHLAETLFEPLLANCSPVEAAKPERRRVPSLEA